MLWLWLSGRIGFLLSFLGSYFRLFGFGLLGLEKVLHPVCCDWLTSVAPGFYGRCQEEEEHHGARLLMG